MESNGPICIVDDEQSIRETLEAVLKDEGYQVISCSNAESFQQQLKELTPSLVLLDIWLPGRDGMSVLEELRDTHPELPVLMMSGHTGIESAVSANKLGARDFLEKPLHLEVILNKIASILSRKRLQFLEELPSDTRLEEAKIINRVIPEESVFLEASDIPQKTLKKNVVLNGMGLISGRNTGLILSPLPENSGIIFRTLDGTSIPGNITSLENYEHAVATHTFTANSTVLATQNRRVRTIEHLMSALSMEGISNVLIKVDEEVPNIDGSAVDFCRLIQEAGVKEQKENVKFAVVHKHIQVGIGELDKKHLYVEPYEGFEIRMRVNYPEPILEQECVFNPEKESFSESIAPARSFNTFGNIDTAQKKGTVGSGYLNSHIIIHDGKVINTELRFEDEFVRHKILDLIGDLYLLGYPLRCRVVANMTSHGYNQALVQKLHVALQRQYQKSESPVTLNES